jgi:hypothetical protein
MTDHIVRLRRAPGKYSIFDLTHEEVALREPRECSCRRRLMAKQRTLLEAMPRSTVQDRASLEVSNLASISGPFSWSSSCNQRMDNS